MIEPSVFIRTTEQRHKDAVCHLWKKLEKGGHIYKGFHEGWYSVSDETFVPESQIEERELEGKSIMVHSMNQQTDYDVGIKRNRKAR